MGAASSKKLEGGPCNTLVLNSSSACAGIMPKSADVVVVGAGIHSLIYAIHTRKLELERTPNSMVQILAPGAATRNG